jgi:hypothetical protein
VAVQLGMSQAFIALNEPLYNLPTLCVDLSPCIALCCNTCMYILNDRNALHCTSGSASQNVPFPPSLQPQHLAFSCRPINPKLFHTVRHVLDAAHCDKHSQAKTGCCLGPACSLSISKLWIVQGKCSCAWLWPCLHLQPRSLNTS